MSLQQRKQELNPLFQKILWWNIFISIPMIWTALEVPLSFAFSLEVTPYLIGIDLLISLLFALDLGLQRRFDQSSSKDLGRSIKDNKLQTLVDILSIIPFDALSLVIGIYPFSYLQVWRLLRLVRVFKFAQIYQTLLLHQRFLKIFSIFSICIILIHWMTCIWISLEGVDPVLNLENYVKSLYWTVMTITTVGYGDITPTTVAGYLYANVIMVLGVGFYGFVFTLVSKIMAAIDRHKEAHRLRLIDVSLLMSHYQVPWSFQKDVFEFYNHVIKTNLSGNDYKIIEELPTSLRQEIEAYMKLYLVKNLPMFAKTPEEALKSLGQKLDKKSLSPEQVIIRKGDTGKALYIIGHGSVQISDEKGHPLALLEKGSCFGEFALLEKVTRTANVTALTFCEVYVLSKEDFDQITQEYPLVLDIFREAMADKSKLPNQQSISQSIAKKD